MRDSVLPIPGEAAKMGWWRFAGKGDNALAGNIIVKGSVVVESR